MIASNSGDYILVEFLLDNGACPLIRNKSGYTALSYAARNGHIEIGRLLLFKFTNWETKINDMINGKSTNSNETPLMQAVSGGHRDFAILLLDSGANLHDRTKYGWTPLDFAKSKNFMEIVFLLSKYPNYLNKPDVDK
jgi:ankyrin repeat protein